MLHLSLDFYSDIVVELQLEIFMFAYVYRNGESGMKAINLGIIFTVFFLLMINFNTVIASQKPYIPSYDELYGDDLKQANANKNYFNEPEDALNYADYHYIGAHGAERYPRFFPEYALQEQSIPGILSTGVRGLMITTYDWSLNWISMITEGISVVCSSPRKEPIVFRKNGKPLYQTLHYEMNRIFNFLKSHPKAIITILFDDYADPSKMLRDIQEIIMKNNYDPLLKPSDWPQAQKKGTWPTLGWMRSNNKRLVMFTGQNPEQTKFTWPTSSYFWENNYGTTDERLVCGEEKEILEVPKLKNRHLASFGCFGSVVITPASNNRGCFEYNAIKKLITDCQKRKFAQGKIFNAYWADHIIHIANKLSAEKKKTAFDYVNELNVPVRK